MPFALNPEELLTGTPRQADAFLMNALWKSTAGALPVEWVVHWRDLLRGRGDEFASHMAACQYWLYARQLDRVRVTPTRPGKSRKTGK
ncbi:hypothetical protein GCM10027093_69520 [Paraburkholderia jirisanensis]